ncbi:MAG: peptidoglycan-binding protein [Patescibacteria group bacterium]
MKKIYIGTLLAITLSLSLFGQANAEDVFNQNLYFGISKSSEVTKLQEFLTDQGLYSGPISGNFYSLTMRAVKSFQTQQGIFPVSGYFGPLTRTKANAIANTELGISNQQSIVETGNTPPAPASSSVQLQLEALLKQIEFLQKQFITQSQIASTTQILQEKLENQNQIIQQQSQTLNQIQQNTTPVYVPPPVIAEVRKEIKFRQQNCSLNLALGRICSFEVYYSENDRVTSASITISSDDTGVFLSDCIGIQNRGNPITCPTRQSGYDGKQALNTSYTPSAAGSRTITASANGASASMTISGQAPEYANRNINGTLALSAAFETNQPTPDQLIMGSSNNILGSLKFTETGGVDVIQITKLTFVDEVGSTAITKPTFFNMTLHNGHVLIANSANGVPNSAGTGYIYSFTPSHGIFVPMAGSVSLTFKADVYSSTSGNSTPNSVHQLKISAADIITRGYTSDNTAEVTITNSSAKPQTVVSQ